MLSSQRPSYSNEIAIPHKRKAVTSGEISTQIKRKSSNINGHAIHSTTTADEHSFPKDMSRSEESLGQQTFRYARYMGMTTEYDTSLLDMQLFDDKNEAEGIRIFRKVADNEHFAELPDGDVKSRNNALADLDKIEQLVHPYGPSLVRLYFEIVHFNFPILDKETFLEKFSRSYREIHGPLLAAIYLLALTWWSNIPELSNRHKPNVKALESIAYRIFADSIQRPKLSTIQAGLLLLQRPQESPWGMTTQLVALGQELGLHIDTSSWKIPSWEKSLRKRIAWALFMQDVWTASTLGRPRHISDSNWAVEPISNDDFPPSAENMSEDDSIEEEKGRTIFTAMIHLSKMLSDILESLYSQRAQMELQNSLDVTKAILERAKPIQLRVRTWFSEMPDILRLDHNMQTGKLTPAGSLHLAYFAVEITIHRRVIRSLSSKTEPYLIHICRSAAKARLISAMDYTNRLRPEHLQSFWYFASRVNFALIGSFNCLLWKTSATAEEADFYHRRLQEYRWTLNVSRKSAEFLDVASDLLDHSMGDDDEHSITSSGEGGVGYILGGSTMSSDSMVIDLTGGR